MNKIITEYKNQPDGLTRIEVINESETLKINKKYYKNNPDFIDKEIEYFEDGRPHKICFFYRREHPESWIYSEEESSENLMIKKIKFNENQSSGISECLVYYDKSMNPIYKEIKYINNKNYMEIEKVFYDLKKFTIERIESYYGNNPDFCCEMILFYDTNKQGLLRRKEIFYSGHSSGMFRSTEVYDNEKTRIITEYKNNPQKIIMNILDIGQNKNKIKGETHFEEGKLYNIGKFEVYYENNNPVKTKIYDRRGNIIEEKDGMQSS